MRLTSELVPVTVTIVFGPFFFLVLVFHDCPLSLDSLALSAKEGGGAKSGERGGCLGEDRFDSRQGVRGGIYQRSPPLIAPDKLLGMRVV